MSDTPENPSDDDLAPAPLSEYEEGSEQASDDAGVPEGKEALFTPDEFDIYVNKVTLEAYIFHGKKVDYEAIDHLIYDPESFRVDVVMSDGNIKDLGVKIQWLVRAHLQKANEVSIVQTEKGESIDGKVLPLKIKGQE